MPRLLAVVLTGSAVLWTSLLLAVGFDASRVSPPTLSALVLVTGGQLCHQRPERSFDAGAGPFPVCARCTGLYLAGAIGALAGWVGASRGPRRTRALLVAAAVPTAATLAIEWAGISPLSNIIRFTAALPLGLSAGWLFVGRLRAESEPIHAL